MPTSSTTVVIAGHAIVITTTTHPKNLVGETFARDAQRATGAAGESFLVAFDVPSSARAAAAQHVGSASASSLGARHDNTRKVCVAALRIDSRHCDPIYDNMKCRHLGKWKPRKVIGVAFLKDSLLIAYRLSELIYPAKHRNLIPNVESSELQLSQPSRFGLDRQWDLMLDRVALRNPFQELSCSLRVLTSICTPEHAGRTPQSLGLGGTDALGGCRVSQAKLMGCISNQLRDLSEALLGLAISSTSGL